MTATGLKYYAAIILSVFISSGVWAQIPFESSGTPSTMSYYWGDQRVKLTVNPGQFALYIPPSSEDDAPVKLNRLLESQGIVLAEELIEETPYPGLVFIKDLNGDLFQSLSKLESGWVSPCLDYRGKLHIPTQQFLVSLTSYESSVYQRFVDNSGLRLIREFSSTKPLFLVETNHAPIDFESALEEISSIEGVASVSPNFIMHLKGMAAPNDPGYSSQWHLNNTGQQGTLGVDIEAESAWGIATGGANVVIAIIDEGVDVNHEDLAPNIVAGHDSVTIQASPGGIPGNCDVNDSHGTGCAGLAAARGNNGIGISGVAWNAQIQPVRMGFGNHWTQNDWIIDSLTWSTDNGADILSNSWGGGAPSTAESNTMDYALSVGRNGLGCLLVFASGNESAGVSFPAAYSQTVAVGASSPCDEIKSISSCDGENFWGSNTGPQQSVVAPGVLMVTTDITGPSGMVNGDYTSSFNGTSSATPVVAGALAVILSHDPTLSAATAVDILQIAADDQVGPTGQDGPGFDDNFGHGRLNLANMLALMGGPASPTNLACSETGAGVQISWTPGETYDQVVVRRDGVLLSTLGGNATGFLDVNTPAGQHTWEIQGFVGGTPSLSVNCSLFLIGNAKDLIWSPGTGTVNSGLNFGNDLVQTGREAILTSNLSAFQDLDVFDRIWVMLGMYPNNHQISEAESASLVTFLTNGVGGKAIYMEGGDTWFFDPQRPIHAQFGITATSDGASVDDLATVTGFATTGCDLSGLSLTYTGENSWVDRISANVGSAVVQSNETPAYDVAIYRENGGQLTLGVSYENGGLVDGTGTRLQLVEALLACMGGTLIAPTDLACLPSGSSVTLSWTNAGNWDSIEVVTDGGTPLVLPASATTTTINGLGIGSHTFEVSSIIGTEVSIPAACSIGIAPDGPANMSCTPLGSNVQLSWSNPVAYDSMEVLRNSNVIANLVGAPTSFTDIDPGSGTHGYFVRGLLNGVDSNASSCGVFIPPNPVQGLSCQVTGVTAAISWTNGDTYDNVQVRRNGLLIATLAGAATTFQDQPGSGSHQWSILGVLQSVSSSEVVCNGTVVPLAPSNLVCSTSGANVDLSWSNPQSYSSLIVSRDGLDVATLSGVSTTYGENPGPGSFSYSIRAIAGGVESTSVSCGVIRNPQSVSNLDCQFSGSTATLIWSPEAGLTSILVERNGSLIGTLAGDASFYQENSPPSGQVLYSITPIAGTLSGAATDCSISVPPGPVINLVCSSPADFSAQLNWSAPANLTSIEVRRNGTLLSTLPGSEVSFTDSTAPGGVQSYSLTTITAGVQGGSTSCLVDVTVPSAPVCSFSADVTSGTSPLQVQFTDGSTGLVSSWEWDFGDGITSNQQNPQHVFNAPSVYSVSLTVTGPGGSDSALLNITVTEPAPVAGFSANVVSGIAPLIVQFSDLSTGNINSRSWTFGDSNTSTIQNPEHTYVAPGIYSVSLSVVGPGGSDTSTQTGFIEVLAAPEFVRGDANGDGRSDISDAIQILEFMFFTGVASCESALDLDDDGTVGIADAIGKLTQIFQGTLTPTAPYPDCGSDPTSDGLTCSSQSTCP